MFRPTVSHCSHALLLLAVLALSACGGAAKPPCVDDCPEPELGAFLPDKSGQVNEDGALFTNGLRNVGVNGDIASRMVYGFDIEGIPAGATITRATLQLFLVNETDPSPFELTEGTDSNGNVIDGFGDLVVDHIHRPENLRSTAADNAMLFEGGYETGQSEVINSLGSIDVLPMVEEDFAAGRTFSQFRIRFDNDVSLQTQLPVHITLTDGAHGRWAPKLVIEFTP